MAKKFYAVRAGVKTGIFYTWDECKKMVTGFKGAEYKSFLTEEEALAYLNNDLNKAEFEESDENAVAYVDGSFSKDIKKYSYGCIILHKGERYELSGSGQDERYLSMNNVAGEIFGSMRAVEWAIEHNIKAISIYYDYEGIEKWANDIWKANKEGTIYYKEFIKKSREKIQIKFVKVAAHTGVELNEQVDRLAKNALLI